MARTYLVKVKPCLGVPVGGEIELGGKQLEALKDLIGYRLVDKEIASAQAAAEAEVAKAKAEAEEEARMPKKEPEKAPAPEGQAKK